MKKLLLILCTLICTLSLSAQTKRAWEFGVGSSIYQFNRVPQITFTPGDEENIINVKLRHVVYSGDLHIARELTNVFTWDIGTAIGKIENERLLYLNTGLQFRLAHYFKSPYIDPYFRVGIGYLYKGYLIDYEGEQQGMKWQMWNVNNDSGKDTHYVYPISFGGGVNMWLNDRIGLGFAGNYLYIPQNQIANPIQGTVKLLFRFGGKSKKPQPIVTQTIETIYLDRIVETTVKEIIVDTVKIETERFINMSELLSNIYFNYDSYELTNQYAEIVLKVADLLLKDTSKRYLITGFTDSHGSDVYNLLLSQRRANAISSALIDAGVPSYMLKTRGAGMRIANLPKSASESARQGDRKIIIELITNMEYWNQL